MGAEELKDKIIKHLEVADEKILRVVNAVFESYKNENYVSKTVQGEYLTKEEYVTKVEEADAEISKGNYISVEDLDEESKGW